MASFGGSSASVTQKGNGTYSCTARRRRSRHHEHSQNCWWRPSRHLAPVLQRRVGGGVPGAPDPTVKPAAFAEAARPETESCASVDAAVLCRARPLPQAARPLRRLRRLLGRWCPAGDDACAHPGPGVVRDQREVPTDHAGQLAAFLVGAANGCGDSLVDHEHQVSLGVAGRMEQALIPGLGHLGRAAPGDGWDEGTVLDRTTSAPMAFIDHTAKSKPRAIV
jgi:hypothetical protein